MPLFGYLPFSFGGRVEIGVSNNARGLAGCSKIRFYPKFDSDGAEGRLLSLPVHPSQWFGFTLHIAPVEHEKNFMLRPFVH